MKLEESVAGGPVPLGLRGRKMPISVKVAVGFALVVTVCAVFGDLITPHAPGEQRLLVGDTPPSREFWAGTDLLGRDVLSRTVVGARTALIGATAVAVGAFVVATLLGLLSGYLGGRVDTLIMRWADFMFALPGPLVAIVIVGVMGGGLWTAVATLVILFAAPDARIVRGAVLEQRPRAYIEAARTLGIPRFRIMLVHVLPNVLPLIAAYVVLDFAFALVSLAALSFLGLGVQPGTADWGRMLFENKAILFTNPAALLLPAAVIVATAGSVNIVGDWLYERLAGR